MRMNKKGSAGMSKVKTSVISVWIIAIILLVVLAYVLAELIPEFQTAIASIGALNIPFASFFAADGLIILLLIVAVILFFIYVLLPSGR